MAYQETTTTSYGSRVGNSFKGILTGIVMIIAGTAILWWNEGRAVKQSTANENALEQTIEVADISTVNPEYNGKMIHASGEAATSDVLTDDLFEVSENAFAIIRDVEYYQNIEKSSEQTKDNLGGSQTKVTTYTYTKDWSGSPVNSSKFKEAGHDNFVVVNIESKKTYAQNATFGAYQLPQSFIRSIGGEEDLPVTLSDAKLKELELAVKKSLKQAGIQVDGAAAQPVAVQTVGDSAAVDSTAAANSVAAASTDSAIAATVAEAAQQVAENNYVTVSGNTIYLGQNPNNPSVGDVRITFRVVRQPQTVTVWADVKGNTFAVHADENGKTVGGLTPGVESLQQSFEGEESSNSILTWILRIVGIFLVCGGFKGLFGFLVTILKVVPFLANIANVGVNIVCGVLGFVWSFIIIAIAWIFYRPLLAIILLVACAALIYFLVVRSKGKKAGEPAAPAEADKQ